MFYIYILYSEKADKFYIGHTADVEKRIARHNDPLDITKFTAKYIPWVLSLSFPVSDARADALKVEKFIKAQKSKNFNLRLIQQKNDPVFFEKLVSDVLRK